MRQMWAEIHDTHRETYHCIMILNSFFRKNADFIMFGYFEITTKGIETNFHIYEVRSSTQHGARHMVKKQRHDRNWVEVNAAFAE